MKKQFIFLLLFTGQAMGAPNDLRVLTDKITPTGETSVEVQSAIVSSTATPNAVQGLLEASYGINENLETSIQLPFIHTNDNWQSSGINFETQYITHNSNHFYYGGRVELAYINSVMDNVFWQTELRAIVGFKNRQGHIALNPGITLPVTGSTQKATFEPYIKVAKNLNDDQSIGIEYFGDSGPLEHFLPYSQRNELLFIVFDTPLGEKDLNIGLGKGMTSNSDNWVLKFVIEI